MINLIASIIGTFFVRLGKSNNIMGALYKGFIASALLSLAIMYPVTNYVIGFSNEFNVAGSSLPPIAIMKLSPSFRVTELGIGSPVGY